MVMRMLLLMMTMKDAVAIATIDVVEKQFQSNCFKKGVLLRAEIVKKLPTDVSDGDAEL